MRTLISVTLPGAGDPETLSDEPWPTVLLDTFAHLKPEATYFFTNGGVRRGLIVMDLRDLSDIPAIAEPLLVRLCAKVEFIPVLTADELARAPQASHWAVALS